MKQAPPTEGLAERGLSLARPAQPVDFNEKIRCA